METLPNVTLTLSNHLKTKTRIKVLQEMFIKAKGTKIKKGGGKA